MQSLKGDHSALCRAIRSVPLLPSFESALRTSKGQGDVRARFCPSASTKSTEGFREEGWGLAVCMRWRAAATAPRPRYFTGGIAAPTKDQAFCVVTRPDLFAPVIAQTGLTSDRVIRTAWNRCTFRQGQALRRSKRGRELAPDDLGACAQGIELASGDRA